MKLNEKKMGLHEESDEQHFIFKERAAGSRKPGMQKSVQLLSPLCSLSLYLHTSKISIIVQEPGWVGGGELMR